MDHGLAAIELEIRDVGDLPLIAFGVHVVLNHVRGLRDHVDAARRRRKHAEIALGYIEFPCACEVGLGLSVTGQGQ